MATRFTKSVRERFLAELAETASVARAAAAAGFDKPSLYRRRLGDPAFAHAWRMALLAGYDRIELALIRRALGLADGEEEDREGTLDVELALKLLTRHRPVVEQATVTAKAESFRASPEAAGAVLLAKLRAYAKATGTPLPWPTAPMLALDGPDAA